MITNEEFYLLHKEDDIETLLSTRNHLLRVVRDYEERFILTKLGFSEPRIEDRINDPKKRYILNNEYLLEITKLIIEKTK